MYMYIVHAETYTIYTCVSITIYAAKVYSGGV